MPYIGNVTTDFNVSTANINNGAVTGEKLSAPFDYDSGTFYLDNSNNRVGIGTTNPQGIVNLDNADLGADTWLRVSQSGTEVFSISQPLTSEIRFATPNLSVDREFTWYTRGTERLRINANGSLIVNSAAGAEAFTASINGSEVARIDSSGRLLVGTSTSTGNSRLDQKLSVVSTSTSAGGIRLTQYAVASTTAPLLDFRKSRGITDGSFTSVVDGDTLGYIVWGGANGTDNESLAATITCQVDGEVGTAGDTTDMPGRLVFSTTADGSSSPTERMRIGQNGQFTFQTPANPAFVFTDTNPNNTGSRAALQITTGTFNTSDTTSLYCNFLRGDGTQRGRIRSNGATAVAYETTSDYRLKENVVTLSNGIDRLQQLKPYRFNFIDDGPDRVVDGFIAHEVQEVVHEAVGGTKDAVDADGNPVYQGIDQSKLVPLLTAALQEAIAKIETLEAKVAALEGV